MTTETQTVPSLNDVRNTSGPKMDSRQEIKPGDYPILELLGVEDSVSEEYGKYTWIHCKVLASDGAGATPAGEEAKIGIRRDATGNLGIAKAISMASFLDVISGGEADRESFLLRLQSGSGVGKRFGSNLTMGGKSGKAKQYTFRAPEGA